MPSKYEVSRLEAYRPLSREEELELVEQYRAGDRDAGTILCNSVLPLALKLASRYAKLRGVYDPHEIDGGANMAVWLAITRFDPVKFCTRLTTYVTFYVKSEFNPKLRIKCLSLDAELVGGYGICQHSAFNFLTLLSCKNSKGRQAQLEDKIDLRIALSRLPIRERKILIWYYVEGKCLREIGEKMGGVKKQYIFTLKKSGLRRLKKHLSVIPVEAKLLQASLPHRTEKSAPVPVTTASVGSVAC